MSTSAFGAGGGSSSSSSVHASDVLLGRTKSCSALPSLLASLNSTSAAVGYASKDCMSLLATLGAPAALTADQHAFYRTQQLKCRVESMRASQEQLASELESERHARHKIASDCAAAVARADAADAELDAVRARLPALEHSHARLQQLLTGAGVEALSEDALVELDATLASVARRVQRHLHWAEFQRHPLLTDPDAPAAAHLPIDAQLQLARVQRTNAVQSAALAATEVEQQRAATAAMEQRLAALEAERAALLAERAEREAAHAAALADERERRDEVALALQSTLGELAAGRESATRAAADMSALEQRCAETNLKLLKHFRGNAAVVVAASATVAPVVASISLVADENDDCNTSTGGAAASSSRSTTPRKADVRTAHLTVPMNAAGASTPRTSPLKPNAAAAAALLFPTMATGAAAATSTLASSSVANTAATTAASARGTAASGIAAGAGKAAPSPFAARQRAPPLSAQKSSKQQLSATMPAASLSLALASARKTAMTPSAASAAAAKSGALQFPSVPTRAAAASAASNTSLSLSNEGAVASEDADTSVSASSGGDGASLESLFQCVLGD